LPLHPRLSLSGLVTLAWSFAEDLAFWRECGLHHVGLFAPKVGAHGPDRVAAELSALGLRVSTIICSPFTLDDRAAWEQERALLTTMIGVAAEVGGVVYGPPGKGWFDEWDANVAAYSEAVAPCLEAAAARGVTLAFEATLRPALSFVHTLVDARDLARASGAGMVVDIGNCYTERGHRAFIRGLGPEMAVVQLSDVAVGTVRAPGPALRILPGEGELPLEDHVRAAVDAGYKGPFEIELLGSGEVDRAAIRRSLDHVSAILDRVIGR